MTDSGDSGQTEDEQRGGRVFPIAAVWTMLAIGGVIIAGIVILVAMAAFIAARRDRREMGSALSEMGADTGSLRKPPQPVEKREAPPVAAASAPFPEAPPKIPASPPSAPPAEKTVAVPLPRMPETTQVVGGTMVIEWHGSLVGVSGPLEGKRLPISSGEGFFIGRDKEVSQVVVDDSRVSRRHVWIGVEGDEAVAVDQGSTNGTFINGERIEKAVLVEGDILTLSDQVVSLRYEP